MINTLQGPLDALREMEVNLITDIATMLGELGDAAQEDRRRLMEVAQDLRELFFLVVIIGEFNAGKSTFVNALLGEELLPMGITPTTEKIELIRYSETANRKATMRDESLREWQHPNTGAPGVAIVDTPGTGSIFQKHETTAKSFLHRSDLVIFLLSAKRAFAETERIYLEMAKNYGKKILLVINQIDTLEPSEQAQVRRFVEQQVKDLLGLQPLVFMVSARQALAAQKNPGTTTGMGGMDAVKAHLRGVFNEAPPAKQKLLSQLDMAVSVVKRYHEAAQKKSDLVKSDTAKVKQVQQELQQQSVGLDKQLRDARTEVDKVFEGIRQRGLSFIDTNLSLRLRPPSKDKLQTEFKEVVIGRALRDINEATNGYVNAVIDHSRLYWRSVIDRLSQLQELVEQEITGLDAGIYAQQRESLQDAIQIAEGELRTYSTGAIVSEIEQTFESNLNGFMTSSIAAIGGLIAVVLALATPGHLALYATASIAFAVGLPVAAIGSYAAWRYYRKVTAETRQDFNARVDKLEATYRSALDDLTRKERNRLGQYGSQVLTPIFSRLETLAQKYAEQENKLHSFIERTEVLRKNIEDAKA